MSCQDFSGKSAARPSVVEISAAAPIRKGSGTGRPRAREAAGGPPADCHSKRFPWGCENRGSPVLSLMAPTGSRLSAGRPVWMETTRVKSGLDVRYRSDHHLRVCVCVCVCVCVSESETETDSESALTVSV